MSNEDWFSPVVDITLYRYTIPTTIGVQKTIVVSNLKGNVKRVRDIEFYINSIIYSVLR